MKKNKRDTLARELARKYGKTYKEMRSEIGQQISAFEIAMSKMENTDSVNKTELEEKTILNYFKSKYEN